MAALDWLTARPVAHRGLHDAAAGVIENMPAAFNAAIAGHYAIECDVQLSADGEAMVHHDFALGRLTEGQGPLASFSAADLKRVPFKATADHMLTLGELCDLVSGRVPLIVEVKSNFDGALPLVQRTSVVLQNYRGPAAAMSFDPNAVEALRTVAPTLIRGIVAERYYRHEEWANLSRSEKSMLGNLLHAFRTRPHFAISSNGSGRRRRFPSGSGSRRRSGLRPSARFAAARVRTMRCGISIGHRIELWPTHF